MRTRSPWYWVPSLYFAEGLPYVAVMILSLVMYKRMGISNTEVALYTSWLNLPGVIKPLWSPFVDLLRTKRCGGGFGTSYEKISNAIDEIYSDDGVIVLMDMGSAVMTAEMVLEAMPERKLVLADCPLVEGAVAATVSAIAGSSLEEIMDELADVRELKKLS